MTNNQISFWTYQELVRNNRAKEAETERSNRTKELEIERSNREQERIAYDRYLEEVRNNKASEAIRWADIAETRRHNQEQESIGWVQAQKYEADANLSWANVTLTSQKTKTEKATTSLVTQQAIAYEDVKNAQVFSSYAGAVTGALNAGAGIAKVVASW